MTQEIEKRLTDEQSKLAADNFNLVHWYMNKKGVPYDDHDGYLSELIRAYIRSCMTYDSKVARFSTYVFRNMEWARKRFVQREKKRIEMQGTSIFGEDDFIIESPQFDNQDAHIRKVEQSKLVSSLIAKLNPISRTVVSGIVSGKSFSDVGKKLGCSREKVRQIYQRSLLLMRKIADDSKVNIEEVIDV